MVGSQSHIYSSSDSDTGKKTLNSSGTHRICKELCWSTVYRIPSLNTCVNDYHCPMLHNKLAFLFDPITLEISWWVMLHSSNQVSTCSKEIHDNFSARNDPPICSRNPMCSTSPTLRQRRGPLELLPRSNGPGFVRAVCVSCSAVPSHYAILIQQRKNGWTVTGLILLSPKNRMGKSIWLKLYLPLVELG